MSGEEFGNFDPRIRHRTNDATPRGTGLGLALLPDLATRGGSEGFALRSLKGVDVDRSIFAVTRTVDSARPAVGALLAAVHRRRSNHPVLAQ